VPVRFELRIEIEVKRKKREYTTSFMSFLRLHGTKGEEGTTR